MAGRPSANAAHEKRLHLPRSSRRNSASYCIICRIKCSITCWRMTPSCWLVSSATVFAIASMTSSASAVSSLSELVSRVLAHNRNDFSRRTAIQRIAAMASRRGRSHRAAAAGLPVPNTTTFAPIGVRL